MEGGGVGRPFVRRTTENVSIKLNFYFSYFLKYIFLRVGEGEGEGVGRAVVEGITEY